MQTLRASAIVKAHAGIATYEEILRVTQIDAADGKSCTACGGVVEDGMIACPWCAAAIADDSCSNCSRQLAPAWRVCPWCRTPAAGSRTPVVSPDDESVLAYVSTALEGVVEVETATTAGGGLDLIGSNDFDGVLVDQRLPDLNGLEVIRLLRSEAHSAALPVMLFTGDVTEDLETAAAEAGVNGCLIKPVDPQLLEERVVALVSLSRRSAA
jgi:CheY-like chemotaxis protein